VKTFEKFATSTIFCVLVVIAWQSVQAADIKFTVSNRYRDPVKVEIQSVGTCGQILLFVPTLNPNTSDVKTVYDYCDGTYQQILVSFKDNRTGKGVGYTFWRFREYAGYTLTLEPDFRILFTRY
jgi:hypothetical protein